MSLFFPEGERYFIHTVRHYRDRITDPGLQQAVTAFIGQEAMHGREHEAYNQLLAGVGLPSQAIEAHVRRVFTLLKNLLPPSAQLSTTIAQEHFTAIVAELVLTDARMIEGADARLRALWRWHALEETEHKAVAFDVYEAMVGRDAKAYVLRAAGLLATTMVFLGLVLYYQQRLLRADWRVRRWEGLGRFVTFMLLQPGMLPRLAGPWLRYLRPGFHPWDHDNRHLLAEMDALVEALGHDPRAAVTSGPGEGTLPVNPGYRMRESRAA
jgi:predicted metal-dependent hydrolase